MDDHSTAPDAPALDLPPLRVVFEWTGDRWTHRLEVSGNPLARPVDLAPEAENPARVVSPAYQQLEFQDAPDGSGRQALGVGQTGPHHFSAVFWSRRIDGRPAIDVDVADRSRANIEFLAATYTVFRTSGDLLSADERRISWSIDADHVLELHALGDAALCLSEAGRSATRIQIVARLHTAEKTHRCRWRWTLESRSSEL
ncbi:MAG: hypothetical protein SFX72_13560 [Isosphaeraceae bacterium]|nr:hypothetical protein [Isosphaeraceae bacterium]